MIKIHIDKDQATVFEADKADRTWIVDKDVTVTSADKAAFYSDMVGTRVMVKGNLEYSGQFGGALSLYGDHGTAVVSRGAAISSERYGVVLEANDQTLVNHGRIDGLRGVFSQGWDPMVHNTGKIIGHGGEGIYAFGLAIEIENERGALIEGQVGIEMKTAEFGGAKLTNHGTIRGEDWAISGGEGVDHVINRGKLVGSVLLGDGDDIFDNRGGKIIGDVAGGNGNDIYMIDDASLAIFESTSGGVDVLKTRISYTLVAGNEIEVLSGFGKGDIHLAGNDIGNELVGNKGNNALSGMGGEDWLNGGKGVDTLTGGDGPDHFVFHIGDGRDTITDFERLGAEHDAIVLRKFPGFDDFDDLVAIAHDTAKGLKLNFGDGDVLVIEGVKLDDLDKSHFDFDV